jgi:glycerol-3-phosphate acyltransferase PlsY
MWVDLLVVLVSYFLGGIPFSHLVARLRAGIDIREHGEGNVGARNVFHVVGPAWGTLAALLDTGKGLAVYGIARHVGVSEWAIAACGLAAPLGHNFSPYLRFSGGKGVSVTMGFLFGYLPRSTLCGAAWIILVWAIARDVNKALVLGIPGVILLPLAFGEPWWTVPYTLSLFLLLGLKKIVDRSHERAVWARAPWDRGRPGFHQNPPPEATDTPHPTEQTRA